MGTLSSCLKKIGLSEHESAILSGSADNNMKDGDAAHIAAVRAVSDYLEQLEAERAGVVSQIAAKGGKAHDAPFKLIDLANLTAVLRKNNLETKAGLANTVDTQEEYDDGSLRQNGAQALEGVSAEPVRGTAGARGSDEGSGTGRVEDAGRDRGASGAGVSTARSGGSGAAQVRSADAESNGRLGGSDDTRGQGAPEPAVERVSTGRNGKKSVATEAPVDGLPAPTVPATDFVITDEVNLGEGGLITKFNDNLAAIRLLKKLESEQRRATSAEQKVLARYVGWGGLKTAFKRPDGTYAKGWETRAKDLESILTPDELESANRSVLDAHYTSKDVVSAMWSAAKHLGFSGGVVLEPSVGIGNFLGLAPADLRENARFLGVELDSLTGRMVKALYPQAIIHAGIGFEDAPIGNGIAQLAIGNPPFGPQGLYFDKSSGKQHLNGQSIHNQFFMGSSDALAPGGLQIMVVSRYLMDKEDNSARAYLAKHMRLLGAVRLPDTAFQENANTEVVTDILFLQKRKEPIEYGDTSRYGWVDTVKVADPLGGEPMTVNAYFATNPDKILGVMDRSGSMNFDNDITVRAREGDDIAKLLAEAIADLPAGVVNTSNEAITQSKRQFDAMRQSMSILGESDRGEGAFFFQDGAMHQVYVEHTDTGPVKFAVKIDESTPWGGGLTPTADGKWFRMVAKLDANGNKVKDGKRNVYERQVFESASDVPQTNRLGAKGFERLRAMSKLRDLLRNQINLETSDATSEEIEENRTDLSAAYQAFVKEFGPINKDTNARAFNVDPDSPLLSALELSYDKGVTKDRAKKTGEAVRAESAVPAPILSQRVIVPYEAPTSADSAQDAMIISLAELGRIDMKRISSLIGADEQEVVRQLHDAMDSPLIFRDPETNTWESRESYLSGNIKRKLAAAQAAGLEKNAAELEKVVPEDIPVTDVGVRLGSVWVPTKMYEAFVKHLLGDDYAVSIHFTKYNSKFRFDGAGSGGARGTQTWGTPDMSAASIVTRLLNSEAVKVFDTVSDGKGGTRQILNEEKTSLAAQKASEIINEFQEWVFADAARRDELGRIYNETYNTLLNRQFDGSLLQMPGKVPDDVLSLRRHQKNGIWRIIQSLYTLLDHCVGAGKTFTMIGAAMELRRMGLAKKPTIVVPNHMVEQFASDVYRLYPGAKVLAAGKKDFEKKNRLRLFSKIATGDWDIVIIPHSSFKFIPIDPQTEANFVAADIKEVTDAIEEEKRESGKKFGTSDLQRIKEKMEQRMKRLLDMKKDELITFEQMGIDQLFIDEAHEFKNLAYSSRLNGVLGLGNKDGSQRAMDIFNKIRVMRESGGRGGVTFATGTPISNSIVEMYNLMRYLGGDTLAEMGLGNFDAWHKQFAEAVTAFEMNEAGGLVEKTRMVRFSNMPELMALYYQFADAVTLDDIKQWYSEDNGGAKFPVPTIKGGKRQNNIVQPTPAQERLLQQMVQDFEALPMIQDPKRRNAERLRLMDRARKISLDARAVNPHIPGEEGGKLSVTADNVARIYREWDEHKGTQLVFLDRSIPKNKGDDARLAEYDALLAKLESTTNIEEQDDIQEQLEKFDSSEMSAIREAQVANWNAYDELKRQFIARGIPENQIAFIQDANTDLQKQDLFDKVNAGDIRVLIGSTPRMGAGTNVQQRIVALHHVDVTWKPSDIEQREGRAERQGNLLYKQFTDAGKLFEIELHAYATERTYDAKMWNIVEAKMRFINALRKYSGARDIESNDQESENMAEMAAMASGDPMMLERVKLDSELKKMEMLRRAHSRKQYGLESQINAARKVLENSPAMIEGYKADEETIHADRLRVDAEAAERTVDVAGKSYSTQREANEAALAEIEAQQAGEENKRYTIMVNGKPLTSKQKIGDEISAALGDDVPFEMVIDGKAFIERAEATKALVAKATEMAMGSNNYQEEVVGRFLGLPLTLFVSDTGYGLSLAGAKQSYAVERYFGTKGEINPQNFSGMYRELLKDATGNVRHHTERLAAAKRDLPELESQYGKPFAMEEEFKTKTERLAEVTKILSEKKAEKQEVSKDADSPIYSKEEGKKLDEKDWLPTGQIVDQVTDLLKQFKTEIPVTIIDNDGDVLPASAVGDDGRATMGFVYRGRIHIVRSGVATPEAVTSTLFHELLHFGIRRFVPEKEYIAQMRELYRADPWIAAKTEAWLDSADGLATAKKYGDEIAAARGVDEALAELAEELHAERTAPGVKIGSQLAKAAQNVISWLKKMAQMFGWKPVVERLNDLQPGQQSKDYVESIFKRLREGDNPPFVMTSKWAYSDPAFSKEYNDGINQNGVQNGSDGQSNQDDSGRVGRRARFWQRLSQGDRFVGDEFVQALVSGRAGAWSGFAYPSGSGRGTDGVEWSNPIAGFAEGHVTFGLFDSNRDFNVVILPNEIIGDKKITADQLRDLSISTFTIRETNDGRLLFGVSEPNKGTTAFDALLEKGKIRETGNLTADGKHRYHKVDLGYGATAKMIQETIRRYAMIQGDIGAIEFTRDTGSKAGSGAEYFYSAQEVKAKFAKDAKSTSVSPSEIRAALIDRFGERGIKALESAGVLKIVRLKDAPDAMRSLAEEQGASALYGADGVAYLFSDRMTAEDAPGKLLHEIGEHYGLERMLGADGWGRMKKRIVAMAKAKGSVAYGAWEGVKANYNEFANKSDSELAGNERFLHEVLAAIGENKAGMQTSLWREMLAAVKEWLASKGLLVDWINEGDIANLVSGSLKNAMRDAEAGLVAPEKMESLVETYFRQIVSAMKAADQLIEDCA